MFGVKMQNVGCIGKRGENPPFKKEEMKDENKEMEVETRKWRSKQGKWRSKEGKSEIWGQK